jgi:hypothetical protein
MQVFREWISLPRINEAEPSVAVNSIARALTSFFAPTLSEPLPEHLVSLVRRLDCRAPHEP